MKTILKLVEFHILVMKMIAITIQAYTGLKASTSDMNEVLNIFMHNDRVVDAVKRSQDRYRQYSLRKRLTTNVAQEEGERLIIEITHILENENLTIFGGDPKTMREIMEKDGVVFH